MKILIFLFICFISVGAISKETNLLCAGRVRYVVKDVRVDPAEKSISILFDENKKYLESELLSPTCSSDRKQLEACVCEFSELNITCSGKSILAGQKNLWRFNFGIDRLSGEVKAIKQRGEFLEGEENYYHNEYYDLNCEIAKSKF